MVHAILDMWTVCILFQAPEERNYHIFYEMLEALTDDQKSQLGLQTAPKYFYLNQVFEDSILYTAPTSFFVCLIVWS